MVKNGKSLILLIFNIENNKYIAKQYSKYNKMRLLNKARLLQSIFRVNKLKLKYNESKILNTYSCMHDN